MSDLRLRTASRALATDPNDKFTRARLLSERVRSGELQAKQLKLAAYLGDEAARLATGITVPLPQKRPGLQALIGGLRQWPKPILVRAVVAAARCVRPVLEGHAEAPQADGAIQSAENWLGCPCPLHQRQARQAEWTSLLPAIETPAEGAISAAAGAARIAATVKSKANQPAERPVWHATFARPAEEVYEAIRRALLPWALEPWS